MRTIDPQVALQELRWSLEDLHREVINDDYEQREELEVVFERAREHFEALDGWLRRGGSLPTEWQDRA